MANDFVEIYQCSDKKYGKTEEDINLFMAEAIASHIGGKIKIDSNHSSDYIDGYTDIKFEDNIEFITISNKNLDIEATENMENVEDIELCGFSFNLKLKVAEANMVKGVYYTTFYINKDLFNNENFIKKIQSYYIEELGDKGQFYLKEDNRYKVFEYIKSTDFKLSVLKTPKKKQENKKINPKSPVHSITF